MIKSLIPYIVLFLSSYGALFAKSLKDDLHHFASSGHVSLTYDEARQILFNEIHAERDDKGYFVEDVYCLKKYYPYGGANPNGRIPNHNILNTEHTWPQSQFSSQFNKGTQKSDLHHLYPTFSKINSERGSYPFAEVTKTRDLSCAESHFGRPLHGGNGQYFEPPDEHKGNVARAMFYFSVRYKIAIDPIQERYLRLWHREDPVDQEERQRNNRIFAIQKNRNPFIDRPELVERISDF